MINWFLATRLGNWCLAAIAGIALLGAVIARSYFRGKDAARGEQLEATLKNIAKGIEARRQEQEKPTDEAHDPYNRDNWGRDR